MLKFIFFIIGLNLFAQAETVFTQTVGTSAFQIVTSREVKANGILARTLEKEIKDPTFELSQDLTNQVLFEVAVYRESQSLAAIKISDEEIKNLVETAESRLQKNTEWKKLEVSDFELKTWIERKKIAAEYMKLKAAALTTIVTDQEIQDYYDKNRVKFGSTPLEDQKNNIRLFLQKDSQKQRVQEWVSTLKTKFQIRNDLADMRIENKLQNENLEKSIELPKKSDDSSSQIK